jgi:hypothetical protein
MTNPKLSPRKSPPKKTPALKQAKPLAAHPPELLRTRFCARQLLGHFRKLLPVSMLATWLATSEQTFYQRAFTPLITLWYLVFQRLSDNHHLSHVVEDAREGGADHLSPRGKTPLSQQLTSEATTSFSDARQRLPLKLLHQTLWHTAAEMAASVQAPKHFGLRVGLIDGSTCRMRPLGDIPKHFPPHRPGNCKKQPYWCLARVLGILCCATGVALDSAMGSLKDSEQALSALVLKRSWKQWLLVGDRNFGVYSVALAAAAAQAQVLFRLTRARAAKLARSNGLKLAPGLDALLSWSPSSHDRCPEGLTPTPILGRLVVLRVRRPGFRPLTLYLFTTLRDQLKCPAQELAKVYAQRWNIELCFRYIKSQMDLGFLECHSADMARKEWLAGLIAYNLIRWTMAAAAALAQVPVKLLSFSRARELLLGWCIRSSVRGRTSESWERLLGRIAKARLPKRRKQRPSEPRAVRNFQKDVAKLMGSRAAARKHLAKTNGNS